MPADAVTLDVAPESRRLDDWYRTINRIYLSQNFHRTTASLFMHLVETCGALGRFVRKDYVPPPSTDFVAKALAWWFALCGKVGVANPEDMIWVKFPYVCSYCRRCPHDPARCTEVRRRILASTGELAPEWMELEHIAADRSRKPVTAGDFVDMFLKIYGVPSLDDFSETIARLMEELGELAEALRVIEVEPHYFLSEAPDVFAWLVKSHCLVAARDGVDAAEFGDRLSEALWSVYPDRCRDCRREECICPPLRRSTLGRLAVAGPRPESELFAPARMFLTPVAMRDHFERAWLTIEVDGKAYRLGADELRDLATGLEFIRVRMEELGEQQLMGLKDLLSIVDEIKITGEMNEDRLIELDAAVAETREELNELPGPLKSQLYALPGGLISAILAAILYGSR